MEIKLQAPDALSLGSYATMKLENGYIGLEVWAVTRVRHSSQVQLTAWENFTESILSGKDEMEHNALTQSNLKITPMWEHTKILG
jgi:hypothetical protein